MSKDQVQLIPLSLIDRPVVISREIIDPEKVRELAESIRESGLLSPVILAPRNGRYEMVAGDRRYLAHKLLNRKEIPAFIKELDEKEIIVIRGIENLQRENLTPSEEAKVYLALHEEGKLTVAAIAKKCGKSHATISRYLGFAAMPEEVRKAVDQKKISLLTLETLREIEDQDSFMYYFQMAASNGVTEKVARLWVDDYLKTVANKYYEETQGNPGGNVEVESKPIFITCESCHNPVEIKKVQHVITCVECARKIRQAHNVKS